MQYWKKSTDRAGGGEPVRYSGGCGDAGAAQLLYRHPAGAGDPVLRPQRHRQKHPGRPVAALCRGGDRQRRPRPGAARYGDRQRRVLCRDLRHQPERHGSAAGGGPAGAGKRKSDYCVATAGGLCPVADLVVSAHPACVGHGTGSAHDAAAQSGSQLLSQLDALVDILADATAHRDDDVSTDQIDQLLSMFMF